MSMSAKRCFLLNLFLIILVVYTLVPVSAGDYNGLTEKIDSFLADPVLNHGIQGVLIESLKDGKVLYQRNPDLVFIPASNFKLLVSAAALDKLGPNYRYQTILYRNGTIDSQGVLRGDLILRGGGDPTLSTDNLRSFVKTIKASGVKKIQGDIIGDESKFDDQRLGWGWSWDDEPYYYSAQLTALCLNENVVNVHVKPGKNPGNPAIVTLEPWTGYLMVVNTAVTGAAKSEKTVAVDRLRGKNIIRVTGNVPLDYKPEGPEEAMTMEDPALYAVTVLKELLGREVINVTGEVKIGKTPDTAAVFDSHSSPAMSEILALLNKPSDNLIAETLLKTLGAEAKGKGTVEAGAEVETEFFKAAGMDVEALRIADGSGLSRQNCISPRNLTSLLKYMYKHPHSKVYLDSLPIAGVDGTLRRRMKGTPAEGNVRAKTGYVSRVSSLSGFVTTKGGEPLVFSILMNNHLCRNLQATEVQNRICEYLAGME